MRKATLKAGLKLLAALIAAAVMAGSSFAQAIDLCATTGTVTMPDGQVIPIWGYVNGSTCSGNATLPGPVLTPEAGATTLTVNLHNDLTEPISFFVPGLRNTSTAGTAGRFTREVAPGETVQYTFDLTNRAGTFLYHSATDRIRTQVPMGLYGALVVTPALNAAYPGIEYDRNEVLVFSAIDPNLNNDPAGFGGARVIKWNPQYFLINGQAFPGTAHLAFNAGEDVLLRLVNAGLDYVVPTLEGGLYADLIAEDGNRYPHSLKQYGVELPAGKTMDAMIRITNAGSYALYDRALRLTNRAATGGGILTYLDVGTGAGILQLGAAVYSVAESGAALEVTVNRIGGSAGAVSVDYATADGTAAGGSDYTAAVGALSFADGDSTPQTFTVPILNDGNFEGNETFTVSLSNASGGATLGTPSGAVVTIIDDDEGPGVLQFSSAAYSAAENGGSIDITVHRIGGSIGLVSVDYATANGTAAAGSDYTAAGGTLSFADGDSTPQAFAVPILDDGAFEGNETFTVILSNAAGGAALGAPAGAVVTISDDDAAPNVAPFANEDVTAAPRNSTGVTFSVTDNDVDSDGTIDATTVVITTGPNTQAGGTVVANNDGTVTYVPRRGFRGTDTFQYTVRDDDGALSNVATVRVNVG